MATKSKKQKNNHPITLTSSVITTSFVIPAKAGIQKNTGSKIKPASSVVERSGMTTQTKTFLGRSLILLGLLIICLVFILTQLDLLTPGKKPLLLINKIPDQTQSYPKTVQIIGATEKITVKKGEYKEILSPNGDKNGGWELSDQNALYLTLSGVPEKPGNIVIYGHNTGNIFSDLYKAKPGDIISVETQTKTLYYLIDSKQTVLPTEVEILKQGNDQRITLYTCTGILDSMRLVISGKRV